MGVPLARAFGVATIALAAHQATVPPPTVPPPTPPTTTAVGGAKPVPPQRPTPGTPPGRRGGPGAAIAGIVSDSLGRTVADAAVRLVGTTVISTTLTDIKGRFSFADIAPGEYVVTARKPGYFDGAFGKRRPAGAPLPLALGPGQSVPDMRIELFRAAVIAGAIVDEVNEPIAGARVIALRRRFVDGAWQFIPAGVDTTDDRGMYRVHGLEPGEYVVATPTTQVATSAAADPLLAVDSPPPAAPEGLAYPALFYPASRHALVAQPVLVVPGEVRYAVDFQWAPVPAYSVSGRLLGPRESIAEQIIALMPADGPLTRLETGAAVTVTAPDGTFTFDRVPRGDYRLEAGGAFRPVNIIDLAAPGAPEADTRGGVFWGRADIDVADEDVHDVYVQMHTSVRVSGRLTAAARTTLPTLAFERVAVTLLPLGPGLTRATMATVRRDGSFFAAHLVPGEYSVRVGTLPPGWYVRRMTAGDRDLLDAPLDLTDGDRADIVIELTDRPTEILGSVRDARMQAAGGATVIVMPAGAARWSPLKTRETRASTNGQFAITGLPPGDYLIVAMDDDAAEGWQDATRLAGLRVQATRITLRDNESRTVALRLAGVRQ